MSESALLDADNIYLDGKINHVSKDYFSVQRQLLCCYTTFAYIILVLPGMRSLGAAEISSEDPIPSVEDLADQIIEILNYFGLGAVMCMGVMAGAYILSLFATKYRERVLGLILVSPLCKAPSWTEWFYNKVPSKCLRLSDVLSNSITLPETVSNFFQVMSNLLYFYGVCGLLKECLLQRYFSKVL
ncbi:hypothetical protein Ahy_B05g074625 isoform C [Arachis hypogaea]|uniref:Pollen-specific protein n=1 Tax=Arachis hypogaea TaxID=3818 RepID=A0A444YZD9_ARAHY|nr:hypothetical protein Ahy_B05g074625 isoform C [Arachis hypogaea]